MGAERNKVIFGLIQSGLVVEGGSKGWDQGAGEQGLGAGLFSTAATPFIPCLLLRAAFPKVPGAGADAASDT